MPTLGVQSQIEMEEKENPIAKAANPKKLGGQLHGFIAGMPSGLPGTYCRTVISARAWQSQQPSAISVVAALCTSSR